MQLSVYCCTAMLRQSD